VNFNEEVGGIPVDARSEALERACPRCEAPVKVACVNPRTGLKAHIPCWDRLRDNQEEK
jgi:hypothetical protein